jgi:protein-tyrosine-phosphatase
VNPKTIAAMRAKGYDLASHRSKSITEVGPGPLDAVVTMRCGDACPDVAAKAREDWSITDPRNMDEREFGLVRDRIEGEVVALLARLALPSS